MGLDMYLTKKIYIGNEYRDSDKQIKISNLDKSIILNQNKISYIIEDVGYWRKANQIHQWFVQNIQKDVDDCGEYGVDSNQLKELLKICKEIKEDNSKASILLPTQEGFFFGNTEYNDWYFKDVEDTIAIIEPLIECKEEIYYHSSW
jgi:hypothetical protein